MDALLARLCIVVGLGVMAMAAVTSCAANIDVNGYRARGGSTGSVTCKGACP